jgi:hypothetical protein
METTKSSNEWWHDHEWFPKMRIADPDGWDRENFHHSFYREAITFTEFENRLAASTLVPREEAEE